MAATRDKIARWWDAKAHHERRRLLGITAREYYAFAGQLDHFGKAQEAKRRVQFSHLSLDDMRLVIELYADAERFPRHYHIPPAAVSAEWAIPVEGIAV